MGARGLFVTPSCARADASPEIDLDKEQKRVVGSPKVHKLAEEILALNLVEASDLSTILKEKLGAWPAHTRPNPPTPRRRRTATARVRRDGGALVRW